MASSYLTISRHWQITSECAYTGLDPDTDHILELAVLITDGELSAPHLEVRSYSVGFEDGGRKGEERLWEGR